MIPIGFFSYPLAASIIAQPFFASDTILSTELDRAYNNPAIYDPVSNKTYLVWQTAAPSGGPTKSVRVSSYEHSSGSWSQPVTLGNFYLDDDAHGTPTIAIDGDGYIYCFFGTHLNDQKWSVSVLPRDITRWTQQPDIAGSYTYAHAEVVGSSMYLFLREATDFNNQNIVLRVGAISGGGVTFGGESNFIDLGSDSRSYMGETHVRGTDIHMIMARSNATDTYRLGVYYFIYDTLTGAVRNFDNSFSVSSGSLPVNLTQANANFRLYDQSPNNGGIPSLTFDSLGNPHIIFTEGVSPTYTLKHFYYNGSSFTAPVDIATIEDASLPFGYDASYTITEYASGVQAFYPKNDGIARRIFSGGSWGSESVVITPPSATPVRNNAYIKNSHPDLRLFASEAGAWSTDADAFNKRLYAYGDSGPTSGAVILTPSDSSWKDTQLLLGFESSDGSTSFINESPSGIRYDVASGSAQVSTAQSKFGFSSLLLDGLGSNVHFPSVTPWNLGLGDFTAEAFVRFDAVNRAQSILSTRGTTGNTGWQFQIDASGQLVLVAWGGGSVVLNIGYSLPLSALTWHHVAFSLDGSTARVFKDGELVASGTTSATISDGGRGLYIGNDPVISGRGFGGHIDEIRIKGTAIYTEPFTAPSAQFARGF